MQKNTNYFLLIFSILLISCHSSKQDPATFSGKQIIFGNGGGFAGAYNEYVLQENGDFYKKEAIKGDYNWVKRLDKDLAEQIFTNYTTLEIEKINMNKPGNIYYFVGMKDEVNEHKLIWGDQIKVDQNLQLFYRILMHHLQA